MTPDEVIALRKLWLQWNYAAAVPDAFVLATHDWTNYVLAMAAAIPGDENIVHPTEEDVRWSWPDGVAIVFSEPITIKHLVTSMTDEQNTFRQVDAHAEEQATRGLIVGPFSAFASMTPDGRPIQLRDEEGNELRAAGHPMLWIGDDPSDIITGHWLPGQVILKHPSGGIAESTRIATALITALGHRLTREVAVSGTRGERRRVARELPGLRVLQLSSGASVRSTDEPGKVEWQRRWMVRGHWRLQPYGPKHSLRRMRWIDPYVKGPEDKPFDARSTVWTT